MVVEPVLARLVGCDGGVVSGQAEVAALIEAWVEGLPAASKASTASV